MKTTAEQIPHLSGLDLFNRLHDGCDMRLHQAPIIRGKREDADKTASHRILIRDVLIRSDQQVVTAFFCQRQQLAIGYFLPADLLLWQTSWSSMNRANFLGALWSRSIFNEVTALVFGRRRSSGSCEYGFPSVQSSPLSPRLAIQ